MIRSRRLPALLVVAVWVLLGVGILPATAAPAPARPLAGAVSPVAVSGAAPSAAGAFGSVAPHRVLDTRAGTGAPAAAVSAGATITVAVAGTGGIPASGVSAVMLNVTVTGPSTWGYLTAYASGATRPNASNLNFTPGQTVPNMVVAPVGADGKVALYNGSAGTTQLIADVAGYYLGDIGPGTLSAVSLPLPPDANTTASANVEALECPAPGTCFAVGSYTGTDDRSYGLIETLSNDTWTATKAPLPGGEGASAALDALSCASPSDCVASGWTSPSNTPLFVRLTAGSWTVTDTPSAPADARFFNAVSGLDCPTAGSCVAVGTYTDVILRQRSIIYTLSGSNWTATPVHPPAPFTLDASFLVAVDCASASSCVAIGGFGVLDQHLWAMTLTQGSWSASLVSEPPNFDGGVLTAIDCVTSSRCVAVGEFHNSDWSYLNGMIASLQAGAWTTVQSPLPPDAVQSDLRPEPGLFDIACPTESTCYAAGVYNRGELDHAGLVVTLSGNAAVPTPVTDGMLAGIACNGTSRCLAAGWGSGAGQYPGQLGLYAGTWSPSAMPVPVPGAQVVGQMTHRGAAACPSPSTCLSLTYYAVDESTAPRPMAVTWQD